MSASQVLLTGHGPEDRWLTEAPNRTYFEAKYNPRVNRLRETFEVPFDNQDATFGGTGRCTIPVKGDYLTRLTLRTVMPPIYPTQAGQYVYPTPSSQVGGTVYVNMGLTQAVADGTTLTANTAGNHYFSIGASVSLAGTAYSIFDLDGTYTVASIPTANSFTCLTTLAGISYNGTVSTPGIQCGDIVSYFSTANSNLWVNNLTNKTWQITNAIANGNQLTFTTLDPSNFPIGTQILLNLPSSGRTNLKTSIISASTCTVSNSFVTVGLFGVQAYSVNAGKTWSYPSAQLGDSWNGVAYGNGKFVMVAVNAQAYSVDNGFTWKYVPSSLTGSWNGVTYGNGVFVMVGTSGSLQAYSIDGITWTPAATPTSVGSWYGTVYGNGTTFVVTGSNKQGYSNDNGQHWTDVTSHVPGQWFSVTYGNGKFVMVSQDGYQAYSITNGVSWIVVPSSLTGSWYGVTYGNGVFVMVGTGSLQAYSIDGITWHYAVSPVTGDWYSISYGDGVFVAVGQSCQAYSTDGLSWTKVTENAVGGFFKNVIFGNFNYTNSISDSVSLTVSPLQLSDRTFSSDTYPSISFANASDAAFWGFDSRQGLTYNLPATPPWTLTQSGWVSGFLPPSTSTYDDSVAHKLCKAVRILVGKQTIKEYSGEYIELQNDLLVPYENKAILKLMNGTLDQTQATVSREYYVNLPLGTKEIPLCALTHQHMSVEIDFDSYLNLSQNLNAGTGDFLDAKSYTTYDASTGLLGGQPINVQTTFSYQQYIFIVTYGGQFIIYDTTQDVADPGSYIVLSAFSGSNLFKQFCVLSGNLYIGLTNGQLVRMIITELIQGNISSFITNNYTPTTGTLTGTIVADFRYVYYTVSNTATSNVFMTQYDTTASFTNSTSYTTVDFTKTFNSGITGVYQTLSTGAQLIVLPQGAPGKLYAYQLNANVQSQWYLLDYSSYAYQITEGVLIGKTIYFVSDFIIVSLNSGSFSSSTLDSSLFVAVGSNRSYSIDGGKTWQLVISGLTDYSVIYNNNLFIAVGSNQSYSIDGKNWLPATTQISQSTLNWRGVAYGNGKYVMVGGEIYSTLSTAYSYDGKSWIEGTTLENAYFTSVTFGNGKFVAVGLSGLFGHDVRAQAYSYDGITWYWTTTTFNYDYYSVAFGNNRFVAVGYDYAPVPQIYSDDGVTWYSVASTLSGDWNGVTFGNGKFIAVGFDCQSYSIDGTEWYSVASPLSGSWYSVTYDNRIFVMVGVNDEAYSTDGLIWNRGTPLSSIWLSVTSRPGESPPIPGNGFINLIAVGNYIYCSTNNVAVQIDTTQDLSTAAAYTFPAPLPVNQYVFANGPRYVSMFAQGDNTATNIFEFDPYPPTPILDASILVDYESLPEGSTKPDKALIGLVQTQKVTDMAHMDIHGPVKELWVTGASDSANVFQYSNLATQSTLSLAGERIVTDDDGTHTFLNVIEPFETHTTMPIRNVSVVSFEFDPESDVPNGTINFSRIRDQVFDGNAQTVWARNYNLLAIQGGTGGLMFN